MANECTTKLQGIAHTRAIHPLDLQLLLSSSRGLVYSNVNQNSEKRDSTKKPHYGQ